MDKEDIIRMARESGMELYGLGKNRERFIYHLERFAALVAKNTLANIDPSSFMSWQEGHEAGRLAEREACAKVCDELAARDKLSNYYAVAAKAIRARGNT